MKVFLITITKAPPSNCAVRLLTYLPWCWSKYQPYSLLFALLKDLPKDPWKRDKNWTVSFLFLFQQLCPKNKISYEITSIFKGQSVPAIGVIQPNIQYALSDINSSLRHCQNHHSWEGFESPSYSQHSGMPGFVIKMDFFNSSILELWAGGILLLLGQITFQHFSQSYLELQTEAYYSLIYSHIIRSLYIFMQFNE